MEKFARKCLFCVFEFVQRSVQILHTMVWNGKKMQVKKEFILLCCLYLFGIIGNAQYGTTIAIFWAKSRKGFLWDLWKVCVVVWFCSLSVVLWWLLLYRKRRRLQTRMSMAKLLVNLSFRRGLFFQDLFLKQLRVLQLWPRKGHFFLEDRIWSQCWGKMCR